MGDVEKVLRWLNYSRHKDGEAWDWISADGQHIFDITTAMNSSDLDYLVLSCVRHRLLSSRSTFLLNLSGILHKRANVPDGHYVFEHAFLIFYRPGDYVEAARFLWDKE